MVRIRNGFITIILGFIYLYAAGHYFVAKPNQYKFEYGRIFGKPGQFSLYEPSVVFRWDWLIFKSCLPTQFIKNGLQHEDYSDYFWGAIGAPLFLFFLTAAGFNMHTRAASNAPQTDKVRGMARVDDPKEYFKIAKKLIPPSKRGIRIHPNVYLPRSAESEGCLVLGSTGSGKTKSCCNMMIKEAYERGDKIIVLDSKGDYSAAFLGKENCHLIAPWDTRSAQWNLAADMPRGMMDADMIGNAALPPIPNDHQPIFRNAAFNIFTGVLNSLYQDNKLTWATLFETISDFKKLKPALAAYPSGMQGYSAISGSMEDATKFLSSLHNSTKWLYYLGRAWPNPSFSLRSWMKDGKGGVLILRFASDFPEFRPMCSMVISILISELLSWPVDKETPVWFILDEIANIQSKIGNLAELITAGRERGGRVVLATQDVSRLFSIYGQDEGRAILNSLRTFVAFWAGDKTNAEYAADCLGAKQEQRITTFSDGKSTQSSKLFESSTSYNKSVGLRSSEVVMASELASLQKGQAFLRVPGLPISCLQWPMTSFESKNAHESPAPWVNEREQRRPEPKEEKGSKDGKGIKPTIKVRM